MDAHTPIPETSPNERPRSEADPQQPSAMSSTPRTIHFIHPDEMRTYREQHEQSLSSSTENQEIHIQLALLLPLSDPSILSACRDADSKFIRNENGKKLRPSSSEYLNLRPLGKLWREQWVLFVRRFHDSLVLVTFDAAVPVITTSRSENGSTEQGIYWEPPADAVDDGGIPGGVTYLNAARDGFGHICVSMATAGRMVSKGGKGLRFSVERAALMETEAVKLERWLGRLST